MEGTLLQAKVSTWHDVLTCLFIEILIVHAGTISTHNVSIHKKKTIRGHYSKVEPEFQPRVSVLLRVFWALLASYDDTLNTQSSTIQTCLHVQAIIVYEGNNVQTGLPSSSSHISTPQACRNSFHVLLNSSHVLLCSFLGLQSFFDIGCAHSILIALMVKIIRTDYGVLRRFEGGGK